MSAKRKRPRGSIVIDASFAPIDEFVVAENKWRTAALRLAEARATAFEAKAAEKRAQEAADLAWGELQMLRIARKHS